MSQRRVINDYCQDINCLVEILNKTVFSYRTLIGGANELNGIALASKREVKDALKRARALGQVIDEVIDTLGCVIEDYDCYCKLKSEVIRCRVDINCIELEIQEELKAQN